MKRFISLLLACLFLLPLCACAPAPARSGAQTPSLKHPAAVGGSDLPLNLGSTDPVGETLRVLRVNNDGFYPVYSGHWVTVEGQTAERMRTILTAAPLSDKTAPRISTAKFKIDSIEKSRATERAFWIELPEGLYRYDVAGPYLCRINDYYGPGKILSLSAEDLTWIERAARYYPRHVMTIQIKDGTQVWTNLFDADPYAYFTDLSYSFSGKNIEARLKIEITVTAARELHDEVILENSSGGCVLYTGSKQKIDLAAGESVRLTLTCGGPTNEGESCFPVLRCQNSSCRIYGLTR